jgi:hypothetical protein
VKGRCAVIEPGKWGAPHHDPRALAFGVAFVLLGCAALLRHTGLDIDGSTLSQLALITLGLAGLVSLLPAKRRARP